jgi:transposase-like protein
LLIHVARPVRHLAGDRWFADETYVKDAGVWSYAYRAVDQHDQMIDVYLSRRRNIGSARTIFTAALAVHRDPGEVITDPTGPQRWPTWLRNCSCRVAQHQPVPEQPRQCDHGQLKARLRPMREVRTNRTASVVIRGHAFIQNLRRDHYELAVDAAPLSRLATAFDELRPAI